MRYLNLQEVLELHDKMIQAMGGLSWANPKQIALLESKYHHELALQSS